MRVNRKGNRIVRLDNFLLLLMYNNKNGKYN
jgi:hypothetical protein